MKKIHFTEYTKSAKRIESYGLILAAVLLFLNITNYIKYPNPTYKTAVTGAIYLFVVWLYLKMFWYKNYVRWSKDSLMLRLNQFRPQTLKINTIKKVSFPEGKLKITMLNNQIQEFDLKNIEETSILQLKEFLKKDLGLRA